MNKQRRKDIDKAREEYGDAMGLFASAKEILETAMEEEQEYVDNMPESLQDGEKGDAARENIDCLEEAIGELDDLLTESALDALDGIN